MCDRIFDEEAGARLRRLHPASSARLDRRHVQQVRCNATAVRAGSSSPTLITARSVGRHSTSIPPRSDAPAWRGPGAFATTPPSPRPAAREAHQERPRDPRAPARARRDATSSVRPGQAPRSGRASQVVLPPRRDRTDSPGSLPRLNDPSVELDPATRCPFLVESVNSQTRHSRPDRPAPRAAGPGYLVRLGSSGRPSALSGRP
jgi:hypothetical protein